MAFISCATSTQAARSAICQHAWIRDNELILFRTTIISIVMAKASVEVLGKGKDAVRRRARNDPRGGTAARSRVRHERASRAAERAGAGEGAARARARRRACGGTRLID